MTSGFLSALKPLLRDGLLRLGDSSGVIPVEDRTPPRARDNVELRNIKVATGTPEAGNLEIKEKDTSFMRGRKSPDGVILVRRGGNGLLVLAVELKTTLYDPRPEIALEQCVNGLRLALCAAKGMCMGQVDVQYAASIVYMRVPPTEPALNKRLGAGLAVPLQLAGAIVPVRVSFVRAANGQEFPLDRFLEQGQWGTGW
jgi:hypothetical protein